MHYNLNKPEGLEKFIDSLGRRIKNIPADIHSAGIACMRHAQKTRDVRLMQRLYVKAFPTSAKGNSALRRKAFKTWVEKHSPIFLTDDDKRKPGLKKEGVNKDFTPFNIEGAAANPFWDFTVEEIRYTSMANYLNPWAAARRLEKAWSENREAVAMTESEYKATLGTLEKIAQSLGGDEEAFKERNKASLEAAKAQRNKATPSTAAIVGDEVTELVTGAA